MAAYHRERHRSWQSASLKLAQKYLPLAIAAVFGVMMLAAAVVIYVPKMIAALFRRRPARKTRVRHA